MSFDSQEGNANYYIFPIQWEISAAAWTIFYSIRNRTQIVSHISEC